MAWLLMCCRPYQSCCTCCWKAADKKYGQIEYKVLKEAPISTAQRLNQLIQMQQAANVYSPHPVVPKAVSVTMQPTTVGVHDTAHRETCLQFSLYYDIQRCALDVQLNEVCDLPDLGDKCSTKVYVLLSSMKMERWMESKIASNSQSPLFNQTFEFHGVLLNELKEILIAFQVHHYSSNHSNNVFGVGKLLLKNADIYGANTSLRITLGEKLKQDPGRNKGDILIVAAYNGDRVLEGTVMKMTNLSRTSLPDPYVQIEVFFKDEHQGEWKSSVKLKTTTPVYNESFMFDINGMDINDVTLRVTVYDHRKFKKSTIIGRVVLGHTSHMQSGREHWESLIQRHGQPVSFWHMLTADLTV